MRVVADLAERYSFGELRVSHEQNLISPMCRKSIARRLENPEGQRHGDTQRRLADRHHRLPGRRFLLTANARSIPIANQIQARFDDWDYLHDLGEIQLNISGCMNSRGHHHVAHLGILGVDKDGKEWYQISLGGSDGTHLGGFSPSIGKIIGPSFAADKIVDAVQTIIPPTSTSARATNCSSTACAVSASRRSKPRSMVIEKCVKKEFKIHYELYFESTRRAGRLTLIRLSEGENPESVTVPAGQHIVPLAVWQATVIC